MGTGQPSLPQDRSRPLRVIGAWCTSAALLLGLAVLLGWLVRIGWADAVDRHWLASVVRLRSPVTTVAMRWVSLLGDPGVLLTATGLVGALLGWRRRAAAPLLLGTSAVGTLVLTVAAKWLIARPRPSHDALVATQSFALPSSHSALVVACLGAMAVALGQVMRPRAARAALWAVVVVAAAAVGFSRVYLGAHWPSDVLVGWLVGSAWLATCAAAAGALLPAARVAPTRVPIAGAARLDAAREPRAEGPERRPPRPARRSA